MLPNLSVVALASIIAMEGVKSPGFTESDLARWLAVAAFLLVIADRVGALYDRHFKQRPDPRDAYEPKGSNKALKAEMERDLTRLETTFTTGLKAIERAITSNRDEIKKEIRELEEDFDKRSTAAKESRERIHRDIEEVKVRTARVENDCEHLKQRDALNHLRHKQ